MRRSEGSFRVMGLGQLGGSDGPRQRLHVRMRLSEVAAAALAVHCPLFDRASFHASGALPHQALCAMDRLAGGSLGVAELPSGAHAPGPWISVASGNSVQSSGCCSGMWRVARLDGLATDRQQSLRIGSKMPCLRPMVQRN